MEPHIEAFINEVKGFSFAPAGCGKTEAIAKFVQNYNTESKILILTHTNAGVISLQKRLSKYSIKKDKYSIFTIDSLCLEFVSSYPGISLTSINDAVAIDWPKIRSGFLKLIHNANIRNLVRSKWSNLIVDEFQDCNKHQHFIVEALSEIFPTVLLGDPLQGLFDLGEEPFEWDTDIHGNYAYIPFPVKPQRWIKTNPDLGAWLLDMRSELITTNQLNFSLKPNTLIIKASDFSEVIKTAYNNIYKYPEDTHLRLHHQGHQCHELSRRLKGTYRSIEELELKDLVLFAQKYDREAKIDTILKFISDLACGFNKDTCIKIEKTIRGLTQNNEFYKDNKIVLTDLYKSFQLDNPKNLYNQLLLLSQIKGVVVFRKELWNILIQSAKDYLNNDDPSLYNSVRKMVDRYRLTGRFDDPRIVGRVRLVKGLEYDHVIVIDIDKFKDPREVYVALTRAKKTLTLFTTKTCLEFPGFNIPNILKT